MKQLIVNADDLGADEARNRGIFEAIEAGRVTSVSVLANGDGFEDAVERWLSRGNRETSLGIHINLSEGRPVSRDLRFLTGQDGFFRGKQATHNLLRQPLSGELKKEIQQEIRLQMEALQAFKTPITHLDGHQHIHVLQSVLPIVLKESSNNGIHWMRIPDEPHPSVRGFMVQPDPQDEAAMFSSLGMEARAVAMTADVESCDHFRGLFAKGRLDIGLLEGLLRDLPIGLTELMVHPGRATDPANRGLFGAFSTIEREKELAALLDPSFPSLLEKYGISLIPFPEMLP